MTAQLLFAVFTILVGVFGCVAYFWGANRLLDIVFPSHGVSGAAAIDNLRRQGLIILTIYLIYPVIATFWLSFNDRAGDQFVGLANYSWAAGDREFRQSIFNNILWLAVVPAACTFLGLVIAVLTDKIWWGTIAKSLIFMPLAISFVGASVIWKFIYEYRGEGQPQIGVLNAIVQYFGGTPQVWISTPFWNNFFLMVILISFPPLSVGFRRKRSRRPSSMAPTHSRSSGKSWFPKYGARSRSSGRPSPSWC